MNRPRTKDRDLPPCVYFRHGAYYLVRNGKWRRLAPDKPTALREYGRLMSGASGGMPAFIAEVLPRIIFVRLCNSDQVLVQIGGGTFSVRCKFLEAVCETN